MVVTDAELTVCAAIVAVKLVIQRVFLCPVWLSWVRGFICLHAWMCGCVCMLGSGCVSIHVHVRAQTLLDHLRASWWRDWAAARMG